MDEILDSSTPLDEDDDLPTCWVRVFREEANTKSDMK